MKDGAIWNFAEYVCNNVMTEDEKENILKEHYTNQIRNLSIVTQWETALEHDCCPICGTYEEICMTGDICSQCGYEHDHNYGPLGQAEAERRYQKDGVHGGCAYCGDGEIKREEVFSYEGTRIACTCRKCGRVWNEVFYLARLEFDYGEVVEFDLSEV